MIKYKSDVLSRLKAAGYSSYKLRRDRIIGQSDLAKIRNGEPTTAKLNLICALLDCQPGDILEYIPDPPDPGEK